MIRISHHLLLCATSNKAACCNREEGEASWIYLKKLLSQLGLEDTSRSEGVVLRSKVDCLRICSNGPILLVWPDGIWYEGITPERIDIIVRQHIIKGDILEEWVFKKTSFAAIQ